MICTIKKWRRERAAKAHAWELYFQLGSRFDDNLLLSGRFGRQEISLAEYNELAEIGLAKYNQAQHELDQHVRTTGTPDPRQSLLELSEPTRFERLMYRLAGVH